MVERAQVLLKSLFTVTVEVVFEIHLKVLNIISFNSMNTCPTGNVKEFDLLFSKFRVLLASRISFSRKLDLNHFIILSEILKGTHLYSLGCVTVVVEEDKKDDTCFTEEN